MTKLKKFLVYLLLPSLLIIAGLWVYDYAANRPANFSEARGPVVIIEPQPELAMMSPRDDETRRDSSYASPRDIYEMEQAKQTGITVTDIKELITYVLGTINGFFGLILLAKQCFPKAKPTSLNDNQ